MFNYQIVAADSTLFHNPECPTPPEIAGKLVVVTFRHWDFARKLQTGIIIVHEAVVSDVMAFFSLAYDTHFPIHKVRPVLNYGFSDDLSCSYNNSSGHNMRLIGWNKKLSKHAAGLAFDINPMQNPCFDKDPETLETTQVIPPDAVYDKTAPGTLDEEHELVLLMLEKGWQWGGRWKFPVDYQHFQKVPEELEHLFKD